MIITRYPVAFSVINMCILIRTIISSPLQAYPLYNRPKLDNSDGKYKQFLIHISWYENW